MPVEKPIVNTSQRSYAGCIVTLVNVETGVTTVRHFGGYDHDPGSAPDRSERRRREGVDDILRDLCANLEPAWRIRTISTPQTIYQDLRGRTPPPNHPAGAAIVAPEAQLLGRLDLLHHWEGFAEGTEHQRRLGRRESRRRIRARLNGQPDA